MQGASRLLATAVACFLAVPAEGGRAVALGIVVRADGASLGTHPVSEGSSIYTGEELSTGEHGSLQMRSGAVLFQLMSNSSAIVRGDADVETQAFRAELATGEAALSIARGAAGEICAQDACVQGGASGPVVMRMRVAGAKQLRIYVKRGTATLSYRGENAKIAEGSSYLVVLDPPDDGAASNPGKKRNPTPKGKAFLLIAIAAVAVTAPLVWKDLESPDRP